MGKLHENISIGFIFFLLIGGIGFGIYKLYQLLANNLISIMQTILYVGLGLLGVLVLLFLFDTVGGIIDKKVFKNE